MWKECKKSAYFEKDLIKDEDDRNGLLECTHRSGLDGWVSFHLSFSLPVDIFFLLFEEVSCDSD